MAKLTPESKTFGYSKYAFAGGLYESLLKDEKYQIKEVLDNES
jgi:hypothetical protein